LISEFFRYFWGDSNLGIFSPGIGKQNFGILNLNRPLHA
jgi:hypothetical protein